MPRLLFEKTGNSIWMSHLDTMRLFQRAFKRAGLHLKHTQGFNPRPSVSIALPMSVGVESRCELLDFDLEGDTASNEEICQNLNRALIAGVKVLEVYDNGAKIKKLALMDCRIRLVYDRGIDDADVRRIRDLFASESVLVEKHSKNGIREQDIIPMIRTLEAEQTGPGELILKARICCQNPSLNPMQLVAAIERYCPDLKPDDSRCSRIEIYDENEIIFR